MVQAPGFFPLTIPLVILHILVVGLEYLTGNPEEAVAVNDANPPTLTFGTLPKLMNCAAFLVIRKDWTTCSAAL
jgi:hypothetical protein